MFNFNFNHSFNQTYINIKPAATKNTFYKTIFFKSQPQKLPQYQIHYKNTKKGFDTELKLDEEYNCMDNNEWLLE